MLPSQLPAPTITAASLTLIICLPFKIKKCLPSRGEITGSNQKIKNKAKYVNASLYPLFYWSSLSLKDE